MTTVLFVLAAVLAGVYTISPLLRPKEEWITVGDEGKVRQSLLQEKESYLRAIKDIEFEHASRKINDRDYETLREDYKRKVAESLHRLEELDGEREESLEKAG
jgi:hypothetical protein